ncbi:RHS repeat-associated core domain-containing protein [Streptomyces laurentii]|uniref:RHS repeat-associated core domain-containing protein n=1 Tax=Streptomyces laurentii TaxID=39478 RepID=UPI0033F9C6E6
MDVTSPAYTPPGASQPVTAVTHTTYDALGRADSVTDPLGRVTRFGYDQLDNLIQQTDPAPGAQRGLADPNPLTAPQTDLGGGGVTRYTWTPTGLQLSATTPMGARTEATYDELGRQLTATRVERYPTLQNLTTRYAWDDAGNQTASTTPTGRTTTSVYNAAGEPTAVTTPGQGTTRFSYDRLGRTTETIDPTNRKTQSVYDSLGNVTEVKDFGTGATVLRSAKAGFDPDGNQISADSPTGGHTDFCYDALGQLVSQTERISATDQIATSFGYDKSGNRTRFTDGRGNTTTYTFNPWNLPESTIEPATPQHPGLADRTWTTVYDVSGQPVTELLPGNVKRQRTYDGLGNLIVETGAGAAAVTEPRSLSYDLDGHLTSVATTGTAAPNAYAYNDRGQLLRAQGPSGDTQYAYDADGAMTSRTDSTGRTAYTYDTAGRLDTTTDPLTGTQVRYDFDAAGRPTLEQYARPGSGGQFVIGAQRGYGYDSLGRLTSDTVTNTGTNTSVTGISYGYDNADRLTKKTTTGTAGASTNTYTYDAAGRMDSWSSGSTTVPYTWDKAGNLTRQGTTNAVYDARNRLESWGTETYAYTARGTTQSVTKNGSTRTVTSDAFERTIANGPSTYTYDSLDRVLTGNGAAFTYDGGSNNLIADGTTAYTRTPDGALLSSSPKANTASAQLAVTDQHTDLVAGLDPTGASVQASRAYDPFGKTTSTNGANPAVGYQSGWTDTTTGEVNMAARWYQPGTGNFASRDTWTLEASPSANANRYAFGLSSPLNYTDATGHLSTDTLERREIAQRRASSAAANSSTNRFSWGGLWRGVKLVGGRSPAGWAIRAFSWASAPVSLHESTCSTSPLCLEREKRRRELQNQKFPCVGTSYCYQSRPSTSHNPTPSPKPTPTAGAGRGGRGNGGPGNGGNCVAHCTTSVAFPPPPPIDKNPNDGKSPIPAISWVPKPDWGALKSTGWNSGEGWAAVIDTLTILGMLGNNDPFHPGIAANELPVTSPSPGNSSGSNWRDEDPCSKPRDERYRYQPLIDGAPTGATALICQQDVKPPRSRSPRKGTWNPPGYLAKKDRDRQWIFNRSHIIADRFNGAWIRENIVSGFRDFNDPAMKKCEDKIANSTLSGERVYYSGQVLYGNGRQNIPTGLRMTASTQTGILFNTTIENRPGSQVTC